MSITDELRAFFDGADGYELWCPHHKKELTMIADRIDAAFEDYIQLPKDADGVPIRIGDYLHSDENGKDFPCRGFALTLVRGDKWWTVECCYDAYSGTTEFVSAKSCHHAKPDSWERIIEDAQADGVRYHNDGRPSDFDALVERCKRLAGDVE